MIAGEMYEMGYLCCWNESVHSKEDYMKAIQKVVFEKINFKKGKNNIKKFCIKECV